MEKDGKFPYRTMERLNGEYNVAMQHVWDCEGSEGWDFVQECGKRAYYQGYADAMAKAVAAIDTDFGTEAS